MEDKYLVTDYKNLLYITFKNVGFGEICYGNYNLVNKEAIIGKKILLEYMDRTVQVKLLWLRLWQF